MKAIYLIVILLSLYALNACSPINAKLDTGNLSTSCKSRKIANEYLIEYSSGKREVIHSESAEEFENTFIKNSERDIIDYGFNFTIGSEPSDTTTSSLKNISSNPVNWAQDFIAAKYIWDLGFKGENVKIAILDTGIDYTSAALSSKILNSFKTDSTYDLNGHGTQVASLIAADPIVENNETLFAGGLAPNAQLFPNKIFEGSSRKTDLNTVLKALDQAIADDVDIINASWGGEEACSHLLENKLNELLSHDILFITSAGDENKNLTYDYDYPGSYNSPMVLVSSINIFGEIPSSANIGGSINLFAPGQDVLTISLGNALETHSGTSLASAFATSGAALLKSAFPQASMRMILLALTEGSHYKNPAAQRPVMDLKSSYLFLADYLSSNGAISLN